MPCIDYQPLRITYFPQLWLCKPVCYRLCLLHSILLSRRVQYWLELQRNAFYIPLSYRCPCTIDPGVDHYYRHRDPFGVKQQHNLFRYKTQHSARRCLQNPYVFDLLVTLWFPLSCHQSNLVCQGYHSVWPVSLFEFPLHVYKLIRRCFSWNHSNQNHHTTYPTRYSPHQGICRYTCLVRYVWMEDCQGKGNGLHLWQKTFSLLRYRIHCNRNCCFENPFSI